MSARLPSRHPLIWFWTMPAIIVLFGLWAWSCRVEDKDLEKDFIAETGHTWKEVENRNRQGKIDHINKYTDIIELPDGCTATYDPPLKLTGSGEVLYECAHHNIFRDRK